MMKRLCSFFLSSIRRQTRSASVTRVHTCARPISEVFGPLLHILRRQAGHLDRVIAAINATGFGLSLGIHSRIGETVEQVRRQARVGNIYVNRSMIGAVVGVQPFGGEGLSGTDRKSVG